MTTPNAAADRLWRVLLIVAGVSLLLGAAALWWFRAAAIPDDPRLRSDSPFLNVHPQVGYVGDAECAHCHDSVTASYRLHPMGRSLEPVSPPRSSVSFTAFGLRYSVRLEGLAVIHREEKPVEGAWPGVLLETPVQYVVGSGTRARSFLVEKDGALTESPISWFRQDDLWAPSPGFGEFHPHFQRPITPGCLFCHANRVEPVAHSLNRYHAPLFRGTSIGCERCHGPGQLHVREQMGEFTPPAGKSTIVNPGQLPPLLRDAVCEQCHLHGQRVLRRGREPFDYRPGLPLHLFWSVFIDPEKQADTFVGHVEQMHASRCHRQSEGKLSCISCHDPHAVPTEQERVEFFRRRCLTCHADKPCAVPQARRKQAEDNCLACHMPRVRSADIDHTSVTDHRIPRIASARKRLANPAKGTSLVLFHREQIEAGDAEAARDLGVALARRDVPRAERAVGVQAQPLLEKAVRQHPDDISVWEALAQAHWLQNHIPEARGAFEKVLALAPQRELTLLDAGTLAMAAGDHERAQRYLQRACELNPGQAGYHTALANAYLGGQRWERAVESAGRALQRDPFNVLARQCLVSGQLRLGNEEQARKEFETLLQLRPAQAASLRQWFESQRHTSGR